MAGIQLSGLASGLDTNSIIEQTMEIERTRIYSKEEDIAKLEEEKKVWGNIDNYMSTLQSQAKDLTFSATFGSRTAESSDESVVTATAVNNTSEVTYTLENIKMAQAGKVTSGAKIGAVGAKSSSTESAISIADTSVSLTQLGYAISDGQISINGETISISANDSLEDIMQNINSSNAGINVTYDEAQQKLKFETKNTGSTEVISFESDTSGFFTSMGIDSLIGQTIQNGVDPNLTNVLAKGETASAVGESTITDANTRFNEGSFGISSGVLEINDKEIDISETDTINLVITKINNANAGVKASFDKSTNQFKLEATTAGSSYKIKLGEDSTGFLNAVGLGDVAETTVSNGVNPDYKRTLDEVAAFDTVADTGFFTINGYTFEVNKSTDTLETIINTVNGSGAGVTLFYDEDNMQVTMIAEDAGDDVTLENDTAGFLGALNLMNQSGDSDGNEDVSVYAGTKATLKINGVEFVKDSNDFTVNGVNITLNSNTSEGEAVKLKVKSDTDKAYTEIEEFVNSYNDLVKYIETNTAKEGVLQGDSTANNILYRLRREMTGVVNGADNEYNQLALVGIEVADSKSSALEIDSSKLKEALSADPDAIKYLFTKNIGTGLVEDETVGVGDGSAVSFKLEGIPENTDDMVIKVGDKEYTVGGSTYSIVTSNDDPGANEVYVDLLTGKIKFGTAPTAGASIFADYNVDSSKTSDGISVRLGNYLKPYTIYNGTMDQHLKTFDNQIEDMNDWIASFEARLQMREQTLRNQYAAMEQAMSESNSTTSWLSSQLSAMSS